MKFEQNIGLKNRAARIVAAALLFAIAGLYFSAENIWVWIAVILGVIFLLEGLFSFCILHGIRGTREMR